MRLSPALFVATTVAALAPSSALAGGLGLILNGGIHEEKAYYYTDSGDQGIDNQYRPNFGYGFDAMLGDKDDKVQGMMRMFIQNDLPTLEPDTGSLEDVTFPAAHEEPMSTVGVGMFGVQWGLYGDPNNVQVVLHTLIGSGFATVDNLEYFQAEVAGGATYALNDRVQLIGTLAMTGRYRKRVSLSENVYLGARYMFD